MTDPKSVGKVKTIEELSDLDIEQIFSEIENAPSGSDQLPEELQRKLAPLLEQLRYVLDFINTEETASYVGRVFVGTTMNRTTTNHFLLVVDETEATAFFRLLGHQIASQSDTQDGMEFPDLQGKEDLMKTPRGECERGRKVLDQSKPDGPRKQRKTIRSRGLTYSEWDGKDCYFDHQW